MSDQAAAREGEAVPALTTQATSVLAPQLLMAARCGDIDRLKCLLQLNDDDEQGTEGAATTGAADMPGAGEQVVLQVDGPAAAAPAPPPPPPPSAGATTTSSSLPAPVLEHGGVTIEGDSLLHVVAECDDDDEESTSFPRCAKMIVRAMEKKGGAAAARLALEARNLNGDTPLHRAAGAGNANMISCLVDLVVVATSSSNTDSTVGGDGEQATAAVKAFVRMQNGCGETALNQAIRAARNRVACINKLMAVDPELACVPHEEGTTSPLYLAISLGRMGVARHLWKKSNGKLSYCGPDGRNVLHAAVCRGQGNREQLLSQLTSQRDRKQKGSTPLHLAASLGGWPDAGSLSLAFPQVWPESEATASLLLDANESVAYQVDDEGMYPIHVAAASGSLGVVKVLLERCPDCATLRDGEGRTFLHVAAGRTTRRNLDNSGVAQYVCERMPQHLASMILNAQDSRGDTALHRAVRAGNVLTFNCLFGNRHVRLDVANKDGVTPRDVSFSTSYPLGYMWIFNPRYIIWHTLKIARAPYGGGRPEVFREKHITERDEAKESDKYTQGAQAASIVAVLIATVTFASAFTLPGGYRGADAAAAAGTPVLAGSYAFHAFVLADALAFVCSVLATVTIAYGAGLPTVDTYIRGKFFTIAYVFLQSAVRSLVASFALGLYLVLAPVDHKIAVAVCVIVSASSLYNTTRQMAYTAIAVRAGVAGILPVVGPILVQVSMQFGSYIIIFGLPAIRKWAR